MHFASYYRWLFIRDWLRIQPSARVLDVGCDDGMILAQVRTESRVGLDLNPRCTDSSVNLICSDARKLPLAHGIFDHVLAFDIIEHIEDDQAVLAELVRTLAENGMLWISTPSVAFSIFPRVLTQRANQGWGHIRNGYSLIDIKSKLPSGIALEVKFWNEPALRFMFVFLRLLNEISSTLACAIAGLCFHIDKRFANGANGHLFIRAYKQGRFSITEKSNQVATGLKTERK